MLFPIYEKVQYLLSKFVTIKNDLMKKILLFLFIVNILSSCVKKKAEPEYIPPTSASVTSFSYFPLKFGNYWVYEVSRIDTLNNSLFLGIDSVYVYDSVMISSKKYYKYYSAFNFNGEQFWRDSLNSYLINEKGKVMCAYNNFTDTFYKYSKIPGLIDTGFTKMFLLSVPVSVPAGNFYNAIDARSTIYYNSLYSCKKIRYCNFIYADSIGMIYERIHYSSNCDDYIKRLIRYKAK